MDAYKAPQADLTTSDEIIYKPVRAIFYGLCITVIVIGIASTLEGIIFGLAMGIQFDDQAAFESLLTGNTVFMVTDIIMTAVLLFIAGKVVAKYVTGKEIKYGIILSLITLAIYLPLFIASDVFSNYPAWYSFLSLATILLAIYFGARSRIRA